MKFTIGELGQIEADNVNDLLRPLRVNKECDIYSVDELVAFIYQSLSIFNETPMFTMFTLGDTSFIEKFYDVLIHGAVCLALAHKSIIEHSDGGFTISDLLQAPKGKELDRWMDIVRVIKKEVIS